MNNFEKMLRLFASFCLVLISVACTTKVLPTDTPAVMTMAAPLSQPEATVKPSQTDPSPSTSAAATAANTAVDSTTEPIYKNPQAPVQDRVENLLSQMTLEEKIGQMTQVEKGSIKPGDITRLYIGSILSGGGGSPTPNTEDAWAKMVDGFQSEAMKTRLMIPLIYGVDAVHGHNNLKGATIFPQNVGLGAANDPKLMEQIGRATAEEMAATGIRWNYAPVVALPQDIRWGRTYEGYSESTDIVTTLGTAYLRGLQASDSGGLNQPTAALATPKHYIGDGGTTWGTSKTDNYKLDQGDMQVDEATLRKLYLPPYKAAVDAGAQSIMVSFSSWNGTKMHAEKHLLTDVLKGELGFKGFLVSDWQAIDQLPGDYYHDVVNSINAGLDMIMVPSDYTSFIGNLTKAVKNGDVPVSRIDDAVRRILTVKFNMGLFEKPYSDPSLLPQVGSDAHRALARNAVAESLVLLKNDAQVLPLSKQASSIFVAGRAADDIGIQSGGWTIEWQGKMGNITPGTTVLGAIQATAADKVHVKYDRSGKFDNETGPDGKPLVAEVGVAVVGETPYAEGVGDKSDLTLSSTDIGLIQRMRERSKKLVVIIISGRPMVITDQLPLADAWVAAWLPGTEGQGVADVLFGDAPFTGKLAYTWPRSNEQLPININNIKTNNQQPLFPFGYGLSK